MWARGLTKAESGMQSLTATVQRRAAHVVKPKLLLGCEPTFHLRQGHPLHVHMSACRAHVFRAARIAHRTGWCARDLANGKQVYV